ncbi:hypothetical protein LPJ53_002408 [Coemansia erecta]|uniref:FAD/NAD(P)-binding domain-containing protein n=1 Tax=Coemansia erecta TaxID=147472 RepID=A0A9W7Y2X2_9FUNG|nr:hypothetical protein LPJ53_002408 [Coemansia erecta]
MSSREIHVVVVGGSWAGVTAVHDLMQLSHLTYPRLHITLVEQRTHYFHKTGIIRGLADRKYAEQMFIPYNRVFSHSGMSNPNHRFVCARLKHIYEHFIEVEGGGRLFYDYLIIATGTEYKSLPVTSSTTAEECYGQYQAMRAAIEAADRIVFVGGGAVGVGLCGEIAEMYPSKTITLVHARNKLLNQDISDAFASTTEQRLQKMGVRVVLGEVVAPPDFGADAIYSTGAPPGAYMSERRVMAPDAASIAPSMAPSMAQSSVNGGSPSVANGSIAVPQERSEPRGMYHHHAPSTAPSITSSLSSSDPLSHKYRYQWNVQSHEVVTKSGIKIECDLTVWTTGSRPQTRFMKTLSPSSDKRPLVDSASGSIIVRPTLQLADPRYPHIFAVGDVNSLSIAEKYATSAVNQAKKAVENIRTLIDDCYDFRIKMSTAMARETASKAMLVPYSGTKKGVVVALGKSQEVSNTWFAKINSWARGGKRGRKYLLDKAQKMLNY